MRATSNRIQVYLEVGEKKTFAGAIEWPGWCRSGPNAAWALGSLFEYRQRYARALKGAGLEFQAPVDASSLVIVERLKGNYTTDFGGPDVPPSDDKRPVDDKELVCFQALLKASWRTFDRAARLAKGKRLRLGPRGGGRSLKRIIQHVVASEQAYLGRIGWKPERSGADGPGTELKRTREHILRALAAAARGDLPSVGPRGGRHWSPRYFVRRVAWHVLDHAWEIEDRVK
jgi:hypothetical protein